VSFAGKSVEDAVSGQLLQAIETNTIDAAIEAAHRADERHRQEREALRLEVEQARYDAQLAGRRYERVDPDMRLVAAELEARWNAALERVRDVEARLAAFETRTVPTQHIDAHALHALAQDLPALWHDSATDMRLKQRIVRILIHEIIVDIDDASREIVLVMHWQGGRHTEMRVTRPWSGRTKRCTDAEAAALVRRMVGRWHDDAIAMQLNLLGWRTGTGNHWTRMRVRELRSRLNLPACDPTQPAWLTAKGAARHLGISPAYAGLLLQRGTLGDRCDRNGGTFRASQTGGDPRRRRACARIPRKIIVWLREHRLRAKRTESDDLVFGNRKGQPLRESKLLRNVLQPAAERAGLGRVTWHQFRHIHSSLLNDLRVPVNIAQEQLGHSSISTTLNIYTHVVDASHRKAIEALERELFPSVPKLPDGPKPANSATRDFRVA
jgi:hypothetical protein